ncbi:hypothetical protein [Klenkia terrae]|uniref:Uncharacterized protein n=1 Tax=Klenkia terrae TaxID=1052259 RepID=A0ABU8ECF0_9ACTN
MDNEPFFHGTAAALRPGDHLVAGLVVREVEGWTRLTPEALAAWRTRLAALRTDPSAKIVDRHPPIRSSTRGGSVPGQRSELHLRLVDRSPS